jgi:hypothetical protein
MPAHLARDIMGDGGGRPVWPPEMRSREGHIINNPIFSNTASWQIADDMTVYSFDGEKVGKVRNYDPQAGYADVQKGWLYKKDVYVPLAAVSSVDEDGITLKLTKEALDDDRYSAPPTLGTHEEPVISGTTTRWPTRASRRGKVGPSG